MNRFTVMLTHTHRDIMDDKEKIEEDDLCDECGGKIKDHTVEDLRSCISVLEGMMEGMM